MSEKPTYYAILTSEVRYSQKLKASEKLLFAEITALTQKDGKCWATNKYFADLYNVSVVSISKWISSLVKHGFISSTIKYKKGTKEIEGRYLTLLNGGIKEKLKGGIKEKFKDNNTRVNNINNNVHFDEFWSLYPRKVNKKNAERAFNRLSAKKQQLAIKDIQTRFEGVEDQKFIPHATTYINGERWEDNQQSTVETNDPFANAI